MPLHSNRRSLDAQPCRRHAPPPPPQGCVCQPQHLPTLPGGRSPGLHIGVSALLPWASAGGALPQGVAPGLALNLIVLVRRCCAAVSTPKHQTPEGVESVQACSTTWCARLLSSPQPGITPDSLLPVHHVRRPPFFLLNHFMHRLFPRYACFTRCRDGRQRIDRYWHNSAG